MGGSFGDALNFQKGGAKNEVREWGWYLPRRGLLVGGRGKGGEEEGFLKAGPTDQIIYRSGGGREDLSRRRKLAKEGRSFERKGFFPGGPSSQKKEEKRSLPEWVEEGNRKKRF